MSRLASPPQPFAQVSPLNGEPNVLALTPTFTWTDSTTETAYRFEIDDDPGFTPPLLHQSPILPENTINYQLPSGLLTASILYHWRIRAFHGNTPLLAGNGPFTFTVDLQPWARTYSNLKSKGSVYIRNQS